MRVIGTNVSLLLKFMDKQNSLLQDNTHVSALMPVVYVVVLSI